MVALPPEPAPPAGGAVCVGQLQRLQRGGKGRAVAWRRRRTIRGVRALCRRDDEDVEGQAGPHGRHVPAEAQALQRSGGQAQRRGSQGHEVGALQPARTPALHEGGPGPSWPRMQHVQRPMLAHPGSVAPTTVVLLASPAAGAACRRRRAGAAPTSAAAQRATASAQATRILLQFCLLRAAMPVQCGGGQGKWARTARGARELACAAHSTLVGFRSRAPRIRTGPCERLRGPVGHCDDAQGPRQPALGLWRCPAASMSHSAWIAETSGPVWARGSRLGFAALRCCARRPSPKPIRASQRSATHSAGRRATRGTGGAAGRRGGASRSRGGHRHS
jgi:hypothetical protein